ANLDLRRTVVTDSRIGAEDAGRPVRIPVVVKCTTETVGFRQMQRTVAAIYGGQEHGIGGRTETNALVSARTVGTTEHREARRGRGRGDHVLGVTLGVADVELDVVAGTGRDVLDLQRSHHRTA